MIFATDIINLRYASDDYKKTEQLKTKFRLLKQERDPMFLTLTEFNEILMWKLRSQYGRQREIRQQNTDPIVRIVTGAAFIIKHDNNEYETELRLGVLTSIKGVAVPVASAILALVFPNDYCVIDFRGWRQVFNQEKNYFTNTDYRRYLAEVRKIAAEINWPVQEVDLAIWELDRRKNT